jgi:phosphopantothenoylcysteine decarboxylase/phosphopantothenate--cysteine ligase
MHAAVMAGVTGSDVVIMAAAVADYTPAGGARAAKIEKSGAMSAMSLDLQRTADILADLGRQRGSAMTPVLVGFAAETGPPVERASEKLHRKRVDLIIANDVTAEGAGFDAETNQVTIVSRSGNEPLPLMSKADVAAAILDRVEQLLVAAVAPV